MVEGLTKKHLFTTHGHNTMEIDLRRGHGGSGWWWGKGEKAGTTII